MIDDLPMATRLAVRDVVFQALRQRATNGQPDTIYMERLLTETLNELHSKKILSSPPVGGMTFFPDFGEQANIVQLIQQTVWELCLQRVIMPAPARRYNGNAFYFDPDVFALTPYGIQLLTASANHIKVYDPEAYLEVFRATSPPPDDEMMRYLAECLAVFQDHHLLATVVLLGAASERLLEVLALQLRDALGTDGESWYQGYTKKRNIAEKFDAITGKLNLKFGNKFDNRDVRTIQLSFEAIRQVRNDVVHQHNYQPSWNEIAGLLHNFVLQFKAVHRIRAILTANPII